MKRAIAACVLVTLALVAWTHRHRLRHLAVPVWASVKHAPKRLTVPTAEIQNPPSGRKLPPLPSRVTGLVRAPDGTLWAATFDQGVFRLGERGWEPAGGLEGRERFVNAIALHDGAIVAGTYRGAIAIDPDGLRRATWVPDRAVEALLAEDGVLIAGTERGPVRLPSGEALTSEAVRVTALARAGGRLYLGAPDGVYSVAWPHGGAAVWRPLVFGSPGADTNVVTALVATPGGVLAGTDNGGVVHVGESGVRSVRFDDPRANEINPGALARAHGAIWAGTQGAGLLDLDHGSSATRHHPWLPRQVSAVSADGDGLLVGCAGGEVYFVAP